MPSNPVPAWHGPRDGILGAPALAPIVIAHTRDVAVSVTDVTAFPDGFSFDLDLRLRETGDAHHQPSNRNATDLQERMYLYSETLLAAVRDHPWRHWPDRFRLEYPGSTIAQSDPPFWTDKPEFPVLGVTRAKRGRRRRQRLAVLLVGVPTAVARADRLRV
jgi:hypothetical protein